MLKDDRVCALNANLELFEDYWRLSNGSKQTAMSIGDFIYLCPYFCFADEEKRDAFAYRHYLDSWGRAVPVFIWCLVNGSIAYPTSMLE